MHGSGCFNQIQLGRYGINGINDVVILLEIKFISLFRQIETFIRLHMAVRIDGFHSSFGHINFIHTDGICSSDNLTVEVGQRHLIIVNQIQTADTASGQCFNSIAAYPADTEYRDMFMMQGFNSIMPDQHLQPGKSIQRHYLTLSCSVFTSRPY